jgi:hexulose-6-phosphate isomerase
MSVTRREFLQTTGAVLAGTALAGTAEARTESKWRKGWMLGGLKPGKVESTFRQLKDAGFEGVELLSPNDLDTSEVLAARDATGLVIHGVSGSVHWGSPLSDPDPAVVEKGLAAIRKEIEDCKAYGGTTVLLVPAVVTPKVSYQEAWDRSHKAIKTILPLAEQHQIKIAIEEVWNRFLLSPLEMARYIDEFESDWVGAYFDVGNCVEYAYPQDWIRTLGKRVLKIHIKEYSKAKRFDHLLGEGEIDWKAVRQALEDVGYRGWITAEVPMKDLPDVVARMNRLFGLE